MLLILKSEEFAHSVDRILIKDLDAILAYYISNIPFDIGSHVFREILTILLSAGILDLHHHTYFIWCWVWNPLL